MTELQLLMRCRTSDVTKCITLRSGSQSSGVATTVVDGSSMLLHLQLAVQKNI